MRGLQRLLVGAVAVSAALTFGVGTANAAGSSGGSKGLVQVGQSGWVSLEYLKKHPDAVPGVSVVETTDGKALGPTNASKCDDDVCINVIGSGLHIDQWSTTAFGNVGCAQATFDFFNGGYADKQSGIICPDGSGPGVYYSAAGPTGWYRDGTEVCNYWQGARGSIPGYPCAEIHD